MAEVKLLSVFQPDSLSGAIMNKTKILFFAGLAVAAMLAGQARATTLNEPPPPGWIINLDGQPVPTNPVHYVQYTTYFFAMQTTTYITFAMRNDTFDSTFLDTIAVTDVGNPGVNLIQNGDFEDGTAPSGGYANAPVDWYYRNPYGALDNSSVACGGYGQSGSGCAWGSGAIGAYDLITQSIATAMGDEYQLSFWAMGPDEGTHWNAICCTGPGAEGNAFNIVAYAGDIPTRAVPEPAELGMFGFGLLLIGGFFTLRRREERQA